MKTLTNLSLLAMTFALLAGAALPAYADDTMTKNDDAMAMHKNDDAMMKKDGSMGKDAMTKSGDHMDKNNGMGMKPDTMSKDGKDKMVPDNTMSK